MLMGLSQEEKARVDAGVGGGSRGKEKGMGNG